MAETLSDSPRSTIQNRSSASGMRAGLGLAIWAVAACLFVGCVSSPLPPRIEGPDRQLVAETTLPYTVAVEGVEESFFARLVLEDLRNAEVFERVETSADLSTPDLRIRMTRPVRGDHVAVIPLFSILTVGLFPSWFPLEYGIAFEVLPGDDDAPCASALSEVQIDASYEGTMVMGWVASLLNIAPGRTVGDVRKTDRYRAAIALAVAQRADDLRLLAGDGC